MAVDTDYAVDVGLPFRFSEDCDLFLDSNDGIIEQAINIITHTPLGSIPLFPEMGSSVRNSVFDPLDDTANLVIDNSLRTAIERLEPRVVLDKQLKFDESADQQKRIVIVPARVIPTNRPIAPKVVIPNNT